MSHGSKMKKKWFGSEKFSLMFIDGFIRNIFILATGTASIQILNFAIMPIITRLYGADTFGALGLFNSILGLLTVLSALSYPIAIVFVKDHHQYKTLISISIKLTLLMGVFVSITLLLLNSNFRLSFNDIVRYLCLAFLPASITVIYSQILLRQKKFKIIAYIGVASAITVAVAKLSTGVYYPTSDALILSTLLGLCLSAVIMHFTIFGISLPINRIFLSDTEISTMKEFKQFPQYRLPHALIAALSQIVPVVLLTNYFGLQVAGYFVLTRTVLMVPVTLLGKAVYDVAYPKLSNDFGVKPITKFLVYTTLGLIAISSIPLVVLFFWGQELFAWVFGSDWSRAGLYASCMSMWFVFNIANRPSVAAVSLLALDKFLLINGISSLFASVTGFVVANYIWGTDTAAILAFFSCAIFSQILLISKVYLRSIKSDKTLLLNEK
jgi:O-antigen/teichoic acid export membrane protein